MIKKVTNGTKVLGCTQAPQYKALQSTLAVASILLCLTLIQAVTKAVPKGRNADEVVEVAVTEYKSTTESEAERQTNAPIWLRAYISILYVGLGVILGCLFGAGFYGNMTLLACALGLLIVLLIVVWPLKKERYTKLLGNVTADLWVSIIALLTVPIAFICVPLLEKLPELDLKAPNVIFNSVALLLGGVALFLGMKGPERK